MALPSTIKDRIVALVGEVEGIAQSLDDYPSGDAAFTSYPAAVTRLMQVPTTRRWLSADTYVERHMFTIILHVTPCSNVDVLAPNTAEMELCEPFKHRVPYHFARRPRLESSTLSDMVYNTDLISDGGIIKIVRTDKSWWGIVFTLPVEEDVTIT